MLYRIVLRYVASYCTALCCIVLYCAMLHRIALYFVVLFCIACRCIAWYCIVSYHSSLHCIPLCYIVSISILFRLQYFAAIQSILFA